MAKVKNTKRVKFNVAIADYRPGQIVDYADMPDGHRFWVDNESILETTKIAEFIKEEAISKPEPKLEKPEEVKEKDELEEKPETNKAEKEKDSEFKNIDGTDAFCPGKNKNGTPCKSTRLMKNGYCYFHQDQAPAGLSGEMPDNLKNSYTS